MGDNKHAQKQPRKSIFSCAIVRSTGAASSLSASLRPLRGALSKRAGLTRLPVRFFLVSNRKNGEEMELPSELPRWSFRFLKRRYWVNRLTDRSSFERLGNVMLVSNDQLPLHRPSPKARADTPWVILRGAFLLANDARAKTR